MLNRISIKGYKVLRDVLTLDKLTRINYLVGENGCGKSSILELLSILSNSIFYNSANFSDQRFGTTSHIFSKDFDFSYDVNIVNVPEKGQLNLVESHFDLGNIMLVESRATSLSWSGSVQYISVAEAIDGIRSKIKFGTDVIPRSIIISALVDLVNDFQFFDRKVVDISRSAYEDSSIHFTLDDDRKINLKSLSSGQLALLSMYFFIQDAVSTLPQKGFNIVCIDEPELHLHPKYQKKVHVILQAVCTTKQNLMFFVATHSPFIISAALKDLMHSSIYMLEKGKLKAGNKNNVAALSTEMLGADKTDLGYHENYCLLEEASMQIFLNELASKQIIKKWAFLSCQGVSKVPQYAETILDIQLVTKLLLCNPFYHDTFCIIIDKLPDPNAEELKWMACWDKKLNGDSVKKRFIVLEKESLEAYYPTQLLERYNTAANEQNADKGKVKCEFARSFAQEIQSVAQLKAFFGTELDILIND